MANSDQYNYYSNPAFCQQSEFYNYNFQPCQSPRKGLSPQRHQSSIRKSPVGAQSPTRLLDIPYQNARDNLPPKPGPKPSKINGNKTYEEQNFYEEMLVDDGGFVKQKKIVVYPLSSDGKNGNLSPRYASISENNNKHDAEQFDEYRSAFRKQENRYTIVQITDDDLPQNSNVQKNRYEYIQLQKQDANHNQSIPKKEYQDVEFEMGPRRIHRYSVIPMDEESELDTNNKEYDICPKNPYKFENAPRYQQPEQKRRYEYINAIRETVENQTIKKHHQDVTVQHVKTITSPMPIRRPANPYATQKLHELLTTPKKSHISLSSPKVISPRSPRKPLPSPTTDPFITPNKTLRKTIHERIPKAQQKLNYTLSTRQLNQEKRHTAIVTPMCSSPVQSVYSETTFSNKSESWMNLSGNKQPVHTTLTVAAVMMIMCGGLTSGLCFYMVSFMGRLYFLDFGIVSGFACLVLGILGCRSRNHYYWLPNRNYMSGYIILTLFSLLTCVGLLVLLFIRPKPGSPLADMTSGAVCGISALSLILASAGVIASYCCKLPPPDNRVEHCARGFTV